MFELKLGKIHTFCQIQHNFMCSENLFKLTSMFSTYFYTKFQNFDILHTFLPLAVAKLSTLKQSLFFCPSCSFEVKTSL